MVYWNGGVINTIIWMFPYINVILAGQGLPLGLMEGM